MKASSIRLLCVFLLSASFFAACKTYDSDENLVRQTPEKNQNAMIENIGENQSPAKDDPEELQKYIKIPFETEEALWKIEPVVKNQTDDRTAPGPTDTKLIAVLKFKSADAQKIVEQAEKYKPATETSMNVESWFPPELVAKSQESADETIKGSVYSPQDFVQAPYLNGSLTRIAGTDYFVLELFTM
jgi:hypothetical protein